MSKNTKLYNHWYLITLRGLLIISLGVLAFIDPPGAKVKFIRLFEIFTLISGLLLIQTALSNRKKSNWQWTLMQGLLDLSFGLLLWVFIDVATLKESTLTFVIAIWFLYSGIIQGVESMVLIHDNVKNWWFELISGMLSFIMAFVIIAFRVRDHDTIFVLLGTLATIQGLFTVAASFVLKRGIEE